MIEIYLVRAIIGFGVFLGAGYIALFKLPRLASPERRGSVKLISALVFGGILVAAIAWAPVATSSARSEAEELLSAYCKKSSDEIFRTIDDVDGLLIFPPPAGTVRANHFHSNETSYNSYVSPPNRAYKFLEVVSSKPGTPVRRFDHPVTDGRPTDLASPTARYALTWMDMTRIQEGNAGLFGEQLIIYDRLTGEVLARRTHHYLVERKRPTQLSDTIHTCDQINIGTDTDYRDRRPRSSYSFVSRVLLPVKDSDNSEPKDYVLNSKSGFLIMDCGPDGVDLSEEVSKENLQVRREGVDLYLDRTDAPDRLVCTHFFDKGKEPSQEKAIRLYDGTALRWNEIIP